jgi:hypothetical protein
MKTPAAARRVLAPAGVEFLFIFCPSRTGRFMAARTGMFRRFNVLQLRLNLASHVMAHAHFLRIETQLRIFVSFPGVSSLLLPTFGACLSARVIAMSAKAVFFSIGCLIAWFVLLPVLVIVGGLALFAYAVFAELGAFLTGIPNKTLDTTAAREMARRICPGYRVRASNARRLPLA